MSELYPEFRVKIREADIGPNQFAVTKVYRVPNNQAETVRHNLRNSIADEYGGIKTAPICISAESDKGYYEHGTFARVIAQFRTPNWQEWMMKNLNKGLVFFTPIQSYQQFVRDLPDSLHPDGFLLNGDDENTADNKFWRVEWGENFGLRTKYRVDVKAIVDENGLIDAAKFTGRISSTSCPNLTPPGLPTGNLHLLMLGSSVNRILGDAKLYDVTWSFIYNIVGWNRQCVTFQYERANAEFTSQRWVNGSLQPGTVSTKWLEVRTGQEIEAHLFETADFSSIDGICSDT